MKRIDWIDISKSIAILLVIAGHTIGTALIRGPIFSFHMPLFFVVSAYTMKYSSSIIEFKRRTIPFIIKTLSIAYGLFIIHRFLTLTIEYKAIESFTEYLKDTAWAIVWSSGTTFSMFGNEYAKIGMMWFLVVFALTRSLYDYIHIQCKDKLLWGGG